MSQKMEISLFETYAGGRKCSRNYCHRDSDDDPFASDGEADLEEDEAAIEEDEYNHLL